MGLFFADLEENSDSGEKRKDEFVISSSGSFRPSSKAPKKVMIDPNTGLYRPIKREEKNSRQNLAESWDNFKTMVYDTADKVPKTIDRLRKVASDEKTLKQRGKKSKDSETEDFILDDLSRLPPEWRNRRVFGGYKEREKEYLAALESQSPEVDKLRRLVSKQTTAGEDEVLLPPSPFESFKSTIYNSIDAVSLQKDLLNEVDEDEESTTSPLTPLQKLPSSAQRPKALQARLLAGDDKFQKAMQELKSENPAARLAAGYKVKQMIDKDERINRKRKLVAERKEQVEAFKASVYEAGDVLLESMQKMAELPEKVSETYQSTVSGTKETIQAVQAIPTKVGNQVDKTKQALGKAQAAVQSGVKSTQKAAEKSKQLPSNFKKNVDQTTDNIQRMLQQTKAALDKIETASKELQTSYRVARGLEKPIPKPPKRPPPSKVLEESSLSTLGWKALKSTGSLAGKVTWAVGKETTKLALKGASIALVTGAKAVEEAVENEVERRELERALQNVPPAKPTTKVLGQEEQELETSASEERTDPEKLEKAKDPQRLSQKRKDIDLSVSDLEREIESALKTANIALKEAEKPTRLDLSVYQLEKDIEDALMMADEAIRSAKAELENKVVDVFEDEEG